MFSSIKFETFIKEEYREPTPTEKSFRKWANLPPANPMVKFYYVKVFNGGRCIDEEKFAQASGFLDEETKFQGIVHWLAD